LALSWGNRLAAGYNGTIVDRRRMGIPSRILIVLEGEGLANDATALILYRFAVAAVSLGVFSFGEAVGMFVIIVVGEILWGIGVGWVMLRLRHWVADPRIEITLSVMTHSWPIGRQSISAVPAFSRP
jgi:NhaP-type Na+/H+ or K+/H+ antiporter